ncbi:MAG: hypothetical protein ABSF18_04490, partial [Gammaproteobacteria bacterium]
KYAGLHFAPYILFTGWIIAFTWMAVTIVSRSVILGVGPWTGMIVVAFIGLQPHSGETFFNITNAQWFLGVVLTLYILVDKKGSTHWIDIILLTLLCLTGPFCILLLPALLVKAFVLKDVKEKFISYSVILICVLVQTAFIFHSERVGLEGVDKPIYDWMRAGIIFFSFGGDWTIRIIALLFWMTAFYVFVRSFLQTTPQLVYNRKIAVLLVFAAILIFFPALFLSKDPLSVLSPIGGAARYYITPYALLFFAIAIVAYYFQWARIILIATLSLICFIQFKSVDNRALLQFHAFAEFAQHKKELLIPINPLWPMYPGMHIKAQPVQMQDISPKIIELTWSDASIYDADYQIVDGVLLLQSEGVDPQIVFDKVSCPGSENIGIEMTLQREHAGWIQIFWSANEHFNEQDSLRRFYPEGLVVAQFAFENTADELFVRFDPTEEKGDVRIDNIDIYCLPSQRAL